MITFLSFLVGLLVINALLLVFSVNDALSGFKRTFKRLTDHPVIKLPTTEMPNTKYKKAV